MIHCRDFSLFTWVSVALATGISHAGGIDGEKPTAGSPERGWKNLITRPYLNSDFTGEEFDSLPTVWPEDWRKKAEAAGPTGQRKVAFERYGLLPSPESDQPALQFVNDGNGGWVGNCLMCHGGKVAGRTIAGLPNTHIAMQTLVDDLFKLRVRRGQPFKTASFLALSLVRFQATNGVSNAQIGSMALIALRDQNLEFVRAPKAPKLVHNDLDAPPLWNVKKKKRHYIDGFVGKSPRVIMQFVLAPQNDAQRIKSWEADFVDVLAWMETLSAPKYPWEINNTLAARGAEVFGRACAECHGTYGPGGKYPERVVPLDEIGTDAVRLFSMTPEHRRFFASGWMSKGLQEPVIERPNGYVAPPLDGIWASAPYFHNGSVPTLWHVLQSADRPKVWKRTTDGYDQKKVGLEVESLDRLPLNLSTDEKRRYFATDQTGGSAAGHEFPDQLSEEEKREVLEYLKTL